MEPQRCSRYPSAGRIPAGAQIERVVPTPLLEGDSVRLSLQASDFQTARRVASGAGRIPAGAQIERVVPTPLLEGDSVRLSLQASDSPAFSSGS
ncbi:flagellar basal body P-ring protein FlgI [Mycobacterium tuberculosis]|uniref:flagellar basal body P-ring protein FlgI n=1 Tax=Mycobacterium tuberculosis TaxID=1773 RepID=UPI00272B58E3|nr:flagellar basal body P-ring protein FlgI [Mycobacterium tuberculosis]